MSSSLSELVSNHPVEKLVYTREKFGEKVGIMAWKGVYPYDYMNSFTKFDEVELPDKKEFFSLLNNKKCSDEDLNHAGLGHHEGEKHGGIPWPIP